MPEQSLTITTDKETIAEFLRSKKVSLWSDWCIHHPDSMEKAVNWFVGEIEALASFSPQTEEACCKEKPAHLLERQRAAA